MKPDTINEAIRALIDARDAKTPAIAYERLIDADMLVDEAIRECQQAKGISDETKRMISDLVGGLT